MTTAPLFSVLLADPPWHFSAHGRAEGSRTAESFYRTMPVADICKLDPFVSAHTTPTAALFLWIPCSQLPAGLAVLRAWGFTFKTVAFLWLKLTRAHTAPARGAVTPGPLPPLVQTSDYGSRRMHFGLGHYTRQQSELCLLATRGQMPVADRAVRQAIVAPIREHSRKPDEQYTLIERLYPSPPHSHLELFARHRRPGWSAWGDEIPQELATGCPKN